MAYYCSRCRLAAEKHYANCPNCGGDLAPDERSCDDFSRMGYRIVGRKTASSTSTAHVTNPVDSVHIRDDDTLAHLRKRYQESFWQNESQDNPRPTHSQWDESDHDSQDDFGDNDFFSHYTNVTSPTRSSRENREPQPEEPITYIPPEPLPNQSHRIRPDFSGWGYGLMAVLRAIPWRLVFTLLILAGVVGVIMTIWNMRYVIVNSILSFLFELMPVFLIIGGIVYMIRAIFR